MTELVNSFWCFVYHSYLGKAFGVVIYNIERNQKIVFFRIFFILMRIKEMVNEGTDNFCNWKYALRVSLR